jgi:hypothetical protein
MNAGSVQAGGCNSVRTALKQHTNSDREPSGQGAKGRGKAPRAGGCLYRYVRLPEFFEN